MSNPCPEISKYKHPHYESLQFVALANGGRAKLRDGLERAELLAQELIPANMNEKLDNISKIMQDLTGTLR